MITGIVQMAGEKKEKEKENEDPGRLHYGQKNTTN